MSGAQKNSVADLLEGKGGGPWSKWASLGTKLESVPQ